MNIFKALIGESLDTIVDRLIPDVNQAGKVKSEIKKSLVDTANNALLAQIEVNKIEAKHKSVFVSGWRPATGWICASALGFNFLIQPLLAYSLAYMSPETPIPPTIELAPLMTVLMGMLGLGGLRTYEKVQGVARS